jgi:branched-chain amino acid transport system ATP-binding protein
MSEPILTVRGLYAGYRDLQVLRGVDLDVAEAGVVAVLGANGVGKTTLNKTLSGLLKPEAGEIRFCGRRIDGKSPSEIVAAGLIHVPEGRRLYPDMSVRDNLQLGAYKRGRRERGRTLEQVLTIFPRLKERLSQRAGTLSGGEQQMVAIGRGLMGQPRLLVLDEPSLGLAPRLVDEMFDLIRRLNREGATILLVEQNVVQSLEIADVAHVMEHGAFTLSGSGATLAKDTGLAKAYLGM